MSHDLVMTVMESWQIKTFNWASCFPLYFGCWGCWGCWGLWDYDYDDDLMTFWWHSTFNALCGPAVRRSSGGEVAELNVQLFRPDIHIRENQALQLQLSHRLSSEAASLHREDAQILPERSAPEEHLSHSRRRCCGGQEQPTLDTVCVCGRFSMLGMPAACHCSKPKPLNSWLFTFLTFWQEKTN